MATSLLSLKRAGDTAKPGRVMLHGTHGIGKTSLGAAMPEPVYLQTEDGLIDPGLADVPTFGLLDTFEAFWGAIEALGNEDHGFQSVIIDSADWLQPLVWAEACRRNKWQDIEQPGYGKGYLAADEVWREVLRALTGLRDYRNMAVLIIAHTEVKRFDPPDSEPYDRYQPKLHGRASALIQEYVDGVFFMNYRVSLVKDDPKDKDSRVRGSGRGQRVLYTEERPTHLAKNRWRMPPMIEMPDQPEQMWAAVAQYLPYYRNMQQQG